MPSPERTLPDRSDEIVGSLPPSFRPSQLDYLPHSVASRDGRWIVSTDTWGDRRLAEHRPDGGWHQLDTPAGWVRRPTVDGTGRLAVYQHAAAADRGCILSERDGRWVEVAHDVEEGAICDWDGRVLARRSDGGHATAVTATGGLVELISRRGRAALRFGSDGGALAVPPGATVHQIVPSADRTLMAVTLRKGARFRTVVCAPSTGDVLSPRPLDAPVTRVAAWIDDHHLVAVEESWPGQSPIVWDWIDGRVDRVWSNPAAGTVRALARSSTSDEVMTATATASAPRHLRSLHDDPSSHPDGDGTDATVVVVDNQGQNVACIVHEPPVEPEGTVFYFPGGPHEPIWAEYSSLTAAMVGLGWRVVRVNTRSSGLREPRLRPAAPFAYGLDDVADALAAIDRLAIGPVATMGMSYGAYIACLAGERSDRCVAVAVLSGFLGVADLLSTRHGGVAEFAAAHLRGAAANEPRRLTKNYLVAHGVADPRIPFPAVVAHRDRADGTFLVVPLEGEGHAIHTDRAARLAYPVLFEWLQGFAGHATRSTPRSRRGR